MSNMYPRNSIEKDCQDTYFYAYYQCTLLVVLFDGHGKEGLPVVDFCSDFIKSYFKTHHSDFLDDPHLAISSVMTECDEELRENHQIDTSLSGTTSILCFLNGNTVYVGCVGDSRAVLGQSKPGLQQNAPKRSNSKFVRQIIPSRPVLAIPLSVDQKPDLPVRADRIVKAGGRVKQMSDEDGNPVGPYRVWTQTKSMPGLAMSRSLGDEVSKTLGVISTPVVSRFAIANDFLIIASDGVWNVITDQEAVDFVEKFRHVASRSRGKAEYPLMVRLR